MKYLTVVIVGIFVVTCAPGLVGAQSLLPAGLPSFGGLFGGGGCAAPGCDPKLGGGLDFLVGYLDTNRSLVTELSAQGDDFAGLLSLRRSYPVRGLWLALLAHGSLNENVGVFARGSWLVAQRVRPQHELYTLQGEENIDPGGSDWTAKPQWYNVDAGLLYTFSSCGVAGNASFIGGFRFDSLDTTFTRSQNFFNIAGLPGDNSDLGVTSYIPYVGLMMQQGPAVKVGLIGFPYVPGTVKYKETVGDAEPVASRFSYSGNFRNSYFLEAFAEYGASIPGGSIGIFGIWSYLHARSDVSVSGDWVGLGNLVQSQSFDFNYDRQNWIFGGKAAITF